MSKTKLITAKGATTPDSTRTAQASAQTAERSHVGAALRGQLSSDQSEVYPFQRSRRDARAGSISQDSSSNWLASQDFITCPVEETKIYFTRFEEVRAFAKTVPTIEKTPEKALADANYRRSIALRQTKERAAKQGIAPTSAHARMLRTAVTEEHQKAFFDNRMARAGYRPVKANIDEKTLLQNWRRFENKQITEQEFFNEFKKFSQDQQVALAFNLARAIARHYSQEWSALENEELDKLQRKITYLKTTIQETAPDKTTKTRLGAELNQAKTEYEAFSSILLERAVKKGEHALERILTPQLGQQELGDVTDLFKNTCTEYNSLIDCRITEVLLQHNGIKDSTLPLLGMPLELRHGALAKKVHARAKENFLSSHGWPTPKTPGERILRATKVVGAVLSMIVPPLFFAWMVKSYRDFNWPLVNIDRRMQLATEHADRHLATFLKNHNRNLAEEWVKDQYMTKPFERMADSQNAGNDPYGLFAAFLNPRSEGKTEDAEARQKLIEDVMHQLIVAESSDKLAAREKRAAQLNASVSDIRTITLDEDDPLETSYLMTIAESIVDGIAAGLHWSAQQQQEIIKS